MTGPGANSQLGETGVYVRRNGPGRRAARLRVLSREPLGARNGLPELEFQGTCARRVAGVQPQRELSPEELVLEYKLFVRLRPARDLRCINEAHRSFKPKFKLKFMTLNFCCPCPCMWALPSARERSPQSFKPARAFPLCAPLRARNVRIH